MSLVEVKNLTKIYGKHRALDNISFSIAPGEIIGFLGPNGAGKTTTMNIMTGFIAATSGEVTIDGLDTVAEPERVKASIGYLPDTPPVYGDMRVVEYLNFVADIKKVKAGRKEMLQDIMRQLSIDDIPKRLIKNLSRGYRQRVGLAQAMVGQPKLIIMDEPTIGLDPKQIIEMRDVVKNLGKKHTVILSSHIMQEVSAVCDRVIIINRGKIVATGTPESLSKGLQQGSIKVRIKGDPAAINTALAAYPIISGITPEPSPEEGVTDLILSGNEGTDIREAIFNCMSNNNLPILLMKSTEMSLEEIFLSFTSSPDGQLRGGVSEASAYDSRPDAVGSVTGLRQQDLGQNPISKEEA